jgi:uncharacterized membrane protein (DUF106 family)
MIRIAWLVGCVLWAIYWISTIKIEGQALNVLMPRWAVFPFIMGVLIFPFIAGVLLKLVRRHLLFGPIARRPE